jgi:putative flippase GtrA
MYALRVWEFVNRPENTFYRFFIIGTASLGVHLLMLMGFIILLGDELLANRLAFVFLSLVQFVGHIHWTFSEAKGISNGKKILSLALFFAGRYAFSFPNQYIFAYLFGLNWINWFGWATAIICQMAASLAIMPFNYLYMKRVVIRIVRKPIEVMPAVDAPAEAVKAD